MPSTKTPVRAKKAAQSTKKTQSTRATVSQPRQLQLPGRVWHKPQTWRQRTPVPDYEPLPKARVLLAQSVRELWAHWDIFGGIVVVYGVLNIVLVRGLAGSSNLETLKNTLTSVTHGVVGGVVVSLGSFTYLLATSGSGNTAGSGVYQTILLLVCSLAIIWTLRQVIARHHVRIRDGFYLGMYPLIPFVLIFTLIGLQLIPLALGAGIYNLVITNGIAAHTVDKVLWLAGFIAVALWSLRMITASIFALYIVTLPDMTPLGAYRTAKRLVYGRRLLIWRKLIFLPVVLFVAAALIEMPLIFFATGAAPWVFFVLSMATLPVVHAYLYSLYREML